jgi:hypothetical protein
MPCTRVEILIFRNNLYCFTKWAFFEGIVAQTKDSFERSLKRFLLMNIVPAQSGFGKSPQKRNIVPQKDFYRASSNPEGDGL